MNFQTNPRGMEIKGTFQGHIEQIAFDSSACTSDMKDGSIVVDHGYMEIVNDEEKTMLRIRAPFRLTELEGTCEAGLIADLVDQEERTHYCSRDGHKFVHVYSNKKIKLERCDVEGCDFHQLWENKTPNSDRA